MRRIPVLTLAVAIAAALPTAAGARPLYTNLYSSSKISSFSVNASGVPTLLPGFPIAAGGFAQALTVSPDGKYMVVQFPFGTDNFLKVYALDGAGGMNPVGGTVPFVSWMPIVFSPTGTHLYAPSDTGGMKALGFSAGTITSLGTAGSIDANDVVITPDGRFLFASDYSNPQIARYAIQADGTLSALPPAPAFEDGGMSMKITPDGRFLLLSTAHLPNGHISAYAIGSNGSLTLTGSALASSGSLSERIALSPDGKHLFVPNFNEDSISVDDVAADGTVSRTKADVPAGIVSPASAAVSDDGRFLYVQNSNGDFLQPYAIAADGSLTAIGAPVGTGGTTDGSTPQMHPAQPPQAKLAVTAAKGPGERSKFSAAGSADTDGGSVNGYAWDFGDGVTAKTQTPTASHKYAKAGIFNVAVAAIDDDGCSANRVFDGTVTLCNGNASARASAKLDTPPSITGLKLSKRRFAPGKRVKIKFRLSEKSRVTLTFRKGRKRIGAVRVNYRAGANSVRFRGYLNGKALKPGKYSITLVARDSAGGSSTAKRKNFRVS